MQQDVNPSMDFLVASMPSGELPGTNIIGSQNKGYYKLSRNEDLHESERT